MTRVPKRERNLKTSSSVKTLEDLRTKIMPKSRRIPDRWENYRPLGRCIAGTRLMAFKVPLKQVLCDNMPPDITRFTPRDLMEWTRNSECPIGLVIDLTNTSRYYDSQEFLRAGIEYQKLFTEGHVVPNESIVKGFTTIVNEYLRQHSNDELKVGVHCTHGVNRTGYLICRYLIETLNWTATRALEAFAEARGHRVERPNYIADLQKISSARQPSKSANGHVEHIKKESVTQPSKTGQRSRQNSGSNASCRRRTPSVDKCNALGIDGRAIDPRETEILDPKTQRYRKKRRTRGELNSVVFEEANRIDGCQSPHKRFVGESYQSKNTQQASDRRTVHETHFRARGQQQQNPRRGDSHNRSSEVRGHAAFPASRGRGQPTWDSYHGYQNYQQPTQYYNAAGVHDSYGMVHESHFNSRTRGQYFQQNPMRGHSHSNRSLEVRGRGASPACRGRPTGQPQWSSFHGYQTYRQPTQFNEYSDGRPVSVKRNGYSERPGSFLQWHA